MDLCERGAGLFILHEKGFPHLFHTGLEKGAAQEKREIAKNLKHAGIPIEVIAENTGLSAEEVEAL